MQIAVRLFARDSRDTERWEVRPLLLTILSGAVKRRTRVVFAFIRESVPRPRLVSIDSSNRSQVRRTSRPSSDTPRVKLRKGTILTYLTRFFETSRGPFEHARVPVDDDAFLPISPRPAELNERVSRPFRPRISSRHVAPSRRLRASEVLGSKRSLGKGHA